MTKHCCNHGVESNCNNTQTKCNCEHGEEKNACCNEWASVPEHYSVQESCECHEKTATDNQWCCCSKNSVQDNE